MLKATLLYGHPTAAVAFENYYTGTHIPVPAKMKAEKRELTKFIVAPYGSETATGGITMTCTVEN